MACCKNYNRYKVTNDLSGRYYEEGYKRCQVCEIFIAWNGTKCPCCSQILGTKPRMMSKGIREVAGFFMIPFLLFVVVLSASFFIIISNNIVYAHTFTSNDSASFLSVIYRVKNEAQLVASNSPPNFTLAHQHAERTMDILNRTWIKEIAETNSRVANDVARSLIGLNSSTPSSSVDIKSKINNLNDLLDEAVSVRISKDDLNNSTIQALAFANIINKIDRRYADAFGIQSSSSNASMSGMNMAKMTAMNKNKGASINMMSMMSNDQSSSPQGHNEMPLMPKNNNVTTNANTNTNNSKMVSLVDYQTTQGLVSIAQSIFDKYLKSKIRTTGVVNDSAAKTSTTNTTKIKTLEELGKSIKELKTTIDKKGSYTDAMIVMHTRIFPNLMMAFDLKLA
jgi:hypothetical protein